MQGELMGGQIHVQASNEDEWWGYDVLEETISQFTGLKDVNETEIYEGDTFSINGSTMFVEYIEDRCCYVLTTGYGYDTRNCKDLNCDTVYGLEITGNIHDKNTEDGQTKD